MTTLPEFSMSRSPSSSPSAVLPLVAISSGGALGCDVPTWARIVTARPSATPTPKTCHPSSEPPRPPQLYRRTRCIRGRHGPSPASPPP